MKKLQVVAATRIAGGARNLVQAFTGTPRRRLALARAPPAQPKRRVLKRARARNGGRNPPRGPRGPRGPKGGKNNNNDKVTNKKPAIPKAAFKRVTDEYVESTRLNMRKQKVVPIMLQEITENQQTEDFHMINRIAAHSGRKTIQKRDMDLFNLIRNK